MIILFKSLLFIYILFALSTFLCVNIIAYILLIIACLHQLHWICLKGAIGYLLPSDIGNNTKILYCLIGCMAFNNKRYGKCASPSLDKQTYFCSPYLCIIIRLAAFIIIAFNTHFSLGCNPPIENHCIVYESMLHFSPVVQLSPVVSKVGNQELVSFSKENVINNFMMFGSTKSPRMDGSPKKNKKHKHFFFL